MYEIILIEMNKHVWITIIHQIKYMHYKLHTVPVWFKETYMVTQKSGLSMVI